MSLNSDSRPGRGRSQDMWPKWMWVAVHILVVVVVAGLWWAIFSEPTSPSTRSTPTLTPNVIGTHGTPQPTLFNTLPLVTSTPTRPTLVESTFTPTPESIVTPTGEPTTSAPTGLAIGVKAKVVGTGGQGVNLRSAAGTGNARVKTLPDGTIVEVIGGPKDANDFTWWQVRDAAGVTGWVVSKYLEQQ
jgi:hypothetical protein